MSNHRITFSPLIVGVMRLGAWGAKLSTQQVESYIDQCLDLGLTDFDHADIYGHYTEEGRFGDVLRRRPDLAQRVQLTTKCGIKILADNRPAHTLKSYNATKAHIIQSTDNSLQYLGVERLKLQMIHRPDWLLHPHEVAEAVEQLKAAGKIEHFGVSNFTASQFDMLNAFTPLATNQIEFSLTNRQPLNDGTLDLCLKLGLSPTAWSPFGGGEIFGASNKPDIQRIQQAATLLGKQYNATIDQILLAWLLKHPAGVVPIVGSSKVSRVASALKATEINLSHEHWYRLLQAATGHEVA